MKMKFKDIAYKIIRKSECIAYKTLWYTHECLEKLASVIIAMFFALSHIAEWIGMIVISPIALISILVEIILSKWYHSAQKREEGK